jgi:predicted acyl esterase
MATGPTRVSATSNSGRTRRSTPGPATGAPIGWRFFDHVVKGAAWDEPTVRDVRDGRRQRRRNAAGKLEHGGRWISAADWPLPEAEPVAFHLHNDGRLDRAAPAADAAPVSYDFDPRIRCRRSAAR